MTAGNVCEQMGQDVLPLLLDNTHAAHRLANKIFRRFGIVSLIYGRPRMLDWFDASCYTLRFPKTDNERLQIEALITFAERNTGAILLLIPCSKTARETVARHTEELESRFMLANDRTALSLCATASLP